MEIKAVKFRKDGFYSQPFASLGYKPEQVTKILLTYRHADHSRHLNPLTEKTQ